MLPFGETILAWRLAQGMTQADLALAARIPRPNLSAIERGAREVTLKTLRALAVALDVRPGILADGMPPDADLPPLSRSAIDRIARAAARRARGRTTRETALAELLRHATSSELARHRSAGSGRRADRAYFLLRTRLSRPEFARLLDRFRAEARPER